MQKFYKNNDEVIVIEKHQITLIKDTWVEMTKEEIENFINPVLTLEQVKTSKISSINIACEKAIISSFKSFSLQAEYLYQSDRDDQLNLMGLVANGIDNFLKCGLVTVILEDSIEKEVITWDYKLHTIAQLKEVLADGAKYKLDLLTKANTLKIQVQNATTVQELDGINW